MKQKVPARTVEVCDTCGRDGYMQKCTLCRGDYCLTCRAIIVGCIVEVPVCRKCGSRDDVKSIVDKYAAMIEPVIRKRNKSISQIGK